MYYNEPSNGKLDIFLLFIISSMFIFLGAYHAYLTFQFKYNGVEKTIFIEKLVDIETRANRVIYYTYKVLMDQKHTVVERYYKLPVNKTINVLVIKNKDSISIAQGRKSDSFVDIFISVSGNNSLLSILEILVVALIIIVWGMFSIEKLKKILTSKLTQTSNP